ncbi:hypothetical protein ACFPIJ_42280 [Dactylosporangium cerinum]|uniref:Uncharacterized protein n=1 Tax=Dactylosporangium cerinum TaxID=1434730 RepID=A0ABV9WAU7_9ACTN
MVGIPQLREASWLITGTDRDPVRHLFVRLEEAVDGSGVWTVELSDCRLHTRDGGHAIHRYNCEADARMAVALIHTLGTHLDPLPTWNPQQREHARWRVRAMPSEPASQVRR